MALATPPPAPPAPPAEARWIRSVLGATALVRFGFGLTLSIFAAYLAGHSNGLSTSDVGTVGLVAGLSPIGEFSTVVGSGVLADRHGRLPVLLVGMAGAAALLVAVSFTRDPWVLGGVNFLFGVASGAILAASLAVIGDDAARSSRGFEMGRFDAANLVGWIGGFAVGLGLLGTLANGDLVWVFRAGAAFLALGALLVYATLHTDVRGVPGAGVDLRRLLGAVVERDVLLVTLPWFVIYMLLGTVFVFLGSASSGVGLPPPELAAIIGGAGLLLVLTQPTFGTLADRHGRTRLMAIGALGFIAVLAGAGWLATFGVSYPALGLVGVG
ncbi:MAG TPA: MFS transporter, partial [Thermoplasmata archaeon]|nr:MFS transporter [Thermoplasmata archaeon]